MVAMEALSDGSGVNLDIAGGMKEEGNYAVL